MPAIPVRFAEPPSVVGTGGGQVGDGALGEVAVLLAAWVDVSGISPGNNKGACEAPEEDPAENPEPELVLAELVAPVAPFADPVVVDGDVAPNGDAVDGDETDGKESDG